VKRDEILRRLEERLARGEISEKTYLEIKERYERQPEESEPTSTAEDVGRSAEVLGVDIARMVRDIVEPILKNVETAIPSVIQSSPFDHRIVSGVGGEAVRIAGHGVVTGAPVRARTFKSSGSGVVDGDLEADEVHVAGSCAFKGSVKAHEFHAAGSADVKGSVQAHELHASGSFEVGGDLRADDISTRGSTVIGGLVEGRDIDIRGRVRIGGRLKAQDILLQIDGDSSIGGGIEGRDIIVRRPGGFFRGGRQLTTTDITGTEIHLESTVASTVSGREVTIGPHCSIGTVEATELTVHESSEVRERHTPPH